MIAHGRGVKDGGNQHSMIVVLQFQLSTVAYELVCYTNSIYGFAMAYRFTKLDRYLQCVSDDVSSLCDCISICRMTHIDVQLLHRTSKRCAEYYLANLPADLVPLWDFHWPVSITLLLC
jgi:hypothetical protein